VRIIEELLERKVAAPVWKTEMNVRGNSLLWPRDTLYPLKLALISPTTGGRSVGIVRWRTKALIFLNVNFPIALSLNDHFQIVPSSKVHFLHGVTSLISLS
jgi:hypothetical protein